MKNDSPPWQEDPKNPTRRSGEKRKDKYGNEIKNVAKHLARKAMNAVKEAVNKNAAVAKKAGAKLKMDPDTGTPDHFTAALRRKKGLDEADSMKHPREGFPEEGDYGYHPNPGMKPQESDSDKDMDVAYKKATEKEARKPLNAKIIEHDNCGTPECCGQCDTAELDEALTRVTSGNKGYGYHGTVEARDDAEKDKRYSAMHRYAKKLVGDAGHLSDAKKPNVMVKHFLDSPHGRHIADNPTDKNITSRFSEFKKKYKPEMHEEVEIDEGVTNPEIKKAYADLIKTPGGSSERKSAIRRYKSLRQNAVKEESELEEKRGLWDNIHAKRKRIKAGSGERMRKPGSEGAPTAAALKASQTEEAYGMWKVDFPKQHAGKAVAAGSVHVKAQNTAHAHKVAAKRVGVDHKMFKSKVTKSNILPEEVEGKVYSVHVKGDSKDHNSPEFKKHLKGWGGELHYISDKGAAYKFKKGYQATGFHHGVKSGFKSLDSEHDGHVNEETLTEISAKGVSARDEFRQKIQRAMSDPANIARAKKVIARKKAKAKEAAANEPKNLVHQLHKSQSINAKVKFYDGKEHEIAPNHHDKFMNKYHGLKSSIEKESLVKRAHKSHEDFLKAIHEEFADFSQEKPNTDSITPANYPTPPVRDDITDYNSDDRHDEYDMVAIENDVAAQIENSEWEDLVFYYDDEDLNYEDSDEDIAEGITPQGRLKKRFNMMRSKSRRNMARNLALKRVATPDRIKSRSVRAARNMVYSRVLRGRDRSTLSATEKTRIEGMVKRMAPMVGRLSLRLQQKERMIDRKRINNRNKRKKK